MGQSIPLDGDIPPRPDAEDRLHKFLFEDSAMPPTVRGEIVSLGRAWRQMSEHHDYPLAVNRLLGEMVAASALLHANIKFDGALVMQIHGDGPVRLLVVECSADLHLRATAKLADAETGREIPQNASLQDLVNANGGGRFAITLDPAQRKSGQAPYQGIVPLEGETIAAVLQDYMLRSQQLETRLWLAADERGAAGLLLQKLPLDGGINPAGLPPVAQSALAREAQFDTAAETWRRVVMLGDTIRHDELLNLPPREAMRRLFHEETIRLFEPVPCAFRCSCSRQRVSQMLLSLGEEEINDTLADQGGVRVNCDFCNRRYEYDAVDCAQLFVGNKSGTGSSGTRH